MYTLFKLTNSQARQDPYPEDQFDPDLPCSLVAEEYVISRLKGFVLCLIVFFSSRKCCYGFGEFC